MSARDAVVPFGQSVKDAEDAIENAHADVNSVKHALSHGCGLLKGYYLAGSVSKLEYEAGCGYLRRIAEQRTAMQSLRDSAVLRGMAEPQT
jgi:hypothetical protein